jgi:hypothetical protein
MALLFTQHSSHYQFVGSSNTKNHKGKTPLEWVDWAGLKSVVEDLYMAKVSFYDNPKVINDCHIDSC